MLFHRSNPQSKIGVFGLSRCSRVYGPLCRADVAFGFNFFSNRTVVASLMQQVSSSLVGPCRGVTCWVCVTSVRCCRRNLTSNDFKGSRRSWALCR